MSAEHEVPIRDESIRLGQLLKLAGVVDDGAMARSVIELGEVTVDSTVEVRRGAQVRPGQTVTFAGQAIRVVAGG
ncbi:RNA-binding S4 domain-containing protein [Phycicoccus sp. Soil748]|uniref:RNA-binding S4 domain-containing protein n=1 Tax=Phycicoccus sp. Soil748 TaxID=1736397 RepID=UPI00070336AD|nr:RNA-binding S4 domain-containing protein [Phycicoccus sp. Soil748]KRE56928.1 RNA-binding protein [Phycicoccus sp. Soil748]